MLNEGALTVSAPLRTRGIYAIDRRRGALVARVG